VTNATPRQWDVAKVRINPEDRDEHPAVIVSPDELCAAERKTKLNVLYGTNRRPGQPVQPHEVVLNGELYNNLSLPVFRSYSRVSTV